MKSVVRVCGLALAVALVSFGMLTKWSFQPHTWDIFDQVATTPWVQNDAIIDRLIAEHRREDWDKTVVVSGRNAAVGLAILLAPAFWYWSLRRLREVSLAARGCEVNR